MEEVADERPNDLQNEVGDKMNGSACQEADGAENNENSSDTNDISKLKSKLSDLQDAPEDQELTNPSNESTALPEPDCAVDDSAEDAVPVSIDQHEDESRADADAVDDSNDVITSQDGGEGDTSMGSEHNMEVEQDGDTNVSEPQEESLDPEMQNSNSVDVSSPEPERPSENTENVDTGLKSPPRDSESIDTADPLSSAENAVVADPENSMENDENSDIADPENLAENAVIADPESPENIENVDIADSESPAENHGNDSSSKDPIAQDSLNDANDAPSSKSIAEDSEDKSMDQNDVDHHSDVSEHTDGNSCEPTETTRFLNIDQDSADADLDTGVSQPHIEDPFSTGLEDNSEAAKSAKEVEDSSETQEMIEEPRDEAEKSDTEAENNSAVQEKSERVSETAKQSDAAEESSEVPKTAEETSEVEGEPAEPIEELDVDAEPEKSEKPSEATETLSEKSLEAETVTESAEKSSEDPKEEKPEVKESSETTEKLAESSEAKVTTGKSDESSEVSKSEEESKEPADKKETEESDKPVQPAELLESEAKMSESTDKAVSEKPSAGDDTEVGSETAVEKTNSSAAVEKQDESMEIAKSPKVSDASSLDKSAEEPEIMEIDSDSSVVTVESTNAAEATSNPKSKIAPAEIAAKDVDKPKTGRPRGRKPLHTQRVEVVIDDDGSEDQAKTPPSRTPKPRGRKKSSTLEKSDAENICIVPDVPQIQAVTSLAKAAPAPTPSPVVTPSGRPQRNAAKTAGLKMKKLMADSRDDDELRGSGIGRANFVRKCAECKKRLVTPSESCLYWETMEFCDEGCLGSYLTKLGKFCANCKGDVQQSSLGKYCVRFGTDINQFCRSQCLEEFKKGLKVCSYCQKDISTGPEGFLAPVGDKGQFKDFCSQQCMVLYESISNNVPEPVERQVCTVCNHEKTVQVKVRLHGKETKLCSEVCFAAFKFANSVDCEKCDMCRKYYHDGSNHVIFYEEELHTFCSKTCMNVYILGKRRIILCNTCKVKKYNFDMIKRVLNNGTTVMACSLNCLAVYQAQKTSQNTRSNVCDNCGQSRPIQYNLNMSDGSLRSFCALACVMNFQTQCKVGHMKVYPIGGPKRVSAKKSTGTDPSVPVISTVTSLAHSNGPKVNSHPPAKTQPTKIQPAKTPPAKTGVIQQIVMRPPLPKPVCNKIIQCRPAHNTKGVSCKPFMTTKSTQTDESKPEPLLIPIPVPIYVPLPCAMYKLPVPFAVPIPLPIPVPMFIPTTRNSAKGIMKQIKKIQKKIPQDPFEAELLMMAEMVAGDKKTDETSSSDDDDDDDIDNVADDIIPEASIHESEDDARALSSTGNQSPAASTKSSISCKAPHLDDLADIEDSLKPATIVPTERPPSEQSHDLDPPSPPISRKARKRTSAGYSAENLGVKRVRRSQDGQDGSPAPPSPPLEIIRPDANMNLKYTYGVNAWRQWVMSKNAELERNAKHNRKPIPFKTELLKLTPDELSYTLCLFLKEVKKPNGTEYAPDTLFYFCLGIQHYLYENGRVDNLFTDPFYESFTDQLDEIGVKFGSLYDGTRQIVTRIEEEHLWESKQLGAHSPHVLLNTLMFFNTKHFNLATVDEHGQLSFAHIMKHWKRSGGGAAVPATSKHQPAANRNVLLRFYPPQSALEGNSRKKKMYEQKENEDNPLRCPVKLYEFYLSKCPESVKTRNDVFYLLPERSCVPDSPVWYSTMALDKKSLVKMLNRIKMVKEVNIALLTL